MNARLARLVVDTGGGICGWVSGTMALRQTGTRAFAAVDDLAQALGKNIADFSGTSLNMLAVSLRQVGARMGALKLVNSIDEIGKITLSNGGVTLFSVFGKRMEGGVLKSVGHALYAYRDSLGRLRILDRGGKAGALPEVFASMEEIAKKYGLQGQWTIKEAVVMENVFAKFMGTISNAPVFVLDVFALAGVNKMEHETVAQAFEVHKVIMKQGKKALEQMNPRYHVVVPGDWPSKIAQRFYDNMPKWPVIFEANRDLIGNDPNLIMPGQRLLIPQLPKVSGIKD